MKWNTSVCRRNVLHMNSRVLISSKQSLLLWIKKDVHNCVCVCYSEETAVSLEKLSLSDPPKASEQQPGGDAAVNTQSDRK